MKPLHNVQEGQKFIVVSKNLVISHCFRIGDIVIYQYSLGSCAYFLGLNSAINKAIRQVVGWEDVELYTEPTSTLTGTTELVTEPTVQLWPL